MASKREKRERKIENAKVVYRVGDKFLVGGLAQLYEVRHVNNGMAWLARPDSVLADVKLDEHGRDEKGVPAVHTSVVEAQAIQAAKKHEKLMENALYRFNSDEPSGAV